MTRAYGFRTSRRSIVRSPPRPRDPSIQRLSFTCFQLIAIDDREPGEPPYAPIQVRESKNAMSAFELHFGCV